MDTNDIDTIIVTKDSDLQSDQVIYFGQGPFTIYNVVTKDKRCLQFGLQNGIKFAGNLSFAFELFWDEILFLVNKGALYKINLKDLKIDLLSESIQFFQRIDSMLIVADKWGIKCIDKDGIRWAHDSLVIDGFSSILLEQNILCMIGDSQKSESDEVRISLIDGKIIQPD